MILLRSYLDAADVIRWCGMFLNQTNWIEGPTRPDSDQVDYRHRRQMVVMKKDIDEEASKAAVELAKKIKQDAFPGLPASLASFQFQSTPVGGYLKWHKDASVSGYGSKRIMTALTIFNHTNGRTEFRVGDQIVSLQLGIGQTVVFDSNIEHQGVGPTYGGDRMQLLMLWESD